MAFHLKQWVNRSIALALSGEDMTSTPILDPEDIAETWAHHCMYEVTETFASDETTRRLVTETITIALTNGVGALPSRVLTQFLPEAVVSDPADATVVRRMTWLPWEDFIRAPIDANRGYFSTKGSSFYLVRPGAAYTPGVGMTGNVDVTVAAGFDMPANETAAITVPLRVEVALVQALAEKLRPRRAA